MGGFCEKLLPSDRWPWSDVSGLQHRPLDGVALPSLHWEWESDWYVDENFGGEPTEKGVGELASLRASPWGGSVLGSAPSIPQCCPHCSVAADLSLRPATPRLLPRVAGDGALGHVAVPSLSSSLPPTFLSFLPQEPYRAPLVFQGWTYAIDFPATYTRDKKWNSCVRRRRWIRYRRYKSRDSWAKVEPAGWAGGRAGPRRQSQGASPALLTTPTLRPCLESSPALGTLQRCVSLHLGDGNMRSWDSTGLVLTGVSAVRSQTEAQSVPFLPSPPWMPLWLSHCSRDPEKPPNLGTRGLDPGPPRP